MKILLPLLNYTKESVKITTVANKISLLIKIEPPVVIGKIDLSKIDSSTKPKTMSKKKLAIAQKMRDRLDSGWGWSFNLLQKNHR